MVADYTCICMKTTGDAKNLRFSRLMAVGFTHQGCVRRSPEEESYGDDISGASPPNVRRILADAVGTVVGAG